MKVQIIHSVVQDMSVVKFKTLNDYFRCISFLDDNNLQWEPLKFSSKYDTASIRLNEHVLNIICKKYGVKNASPNSNTGSARMR